MKFEKFELLALIRGIDDLIDNNGDGWYTYQENETGDYVDLIDLIKKLREEYQKIRD